MTATVRVRPAVDADLPALVAIYNQAIASRVATGHLEPLTVAARQAWFAEHRRPATPLLVAELAGQVVGYATLAAYRGGRGAFAGCRELSYYVAADCRRRGVAGALLEHAVAACPALGVTALVCFLLAANGPSIALLERHGFACWGRLPALAVIDGHTCDHLIYGRRLA
jgi:phosphinothricin acetyltransferase